MADTKQDKTRVRRRGEGGVFIRGTKYYVYYNPPGRKQQKEPTGNDPACGGAVFVGDRDAEKRAYVYLDNIRKKMAAVELGYTDFVGRSAHKVTVNELLDVLMKSKEAEGVKRGTSTGKYTDHSLVSGIKRVREWFGDMRAASLNDTYWDAWKAQELPGLMEEYEKATINKTLAYLRQALRLGVKRRLITSVPGSIADVMFTDDELDNAREVFFEAKEFENLMASTTDPDLRDYFEFGYLTGWRSGSVKSLKWATVNMAEHVLILRAIDTKERYKNQMPLGKDGDALWELIKRRWARRTYKKANGIDAISAYVFHRSGEPIGDIRKTWTTICGQAGLMTPKLDGQGAPVTAIIDGLEQMVLEPSKHYHDLRRTAVRDMLNAGVPWPIVKQITGHRTDAMLERYNIVVDKQKVEAIRQRMGWLNRTQEPKKRSEAK